MDIDFEIFKGKSFKDLCKDIYSNQEIRKDQIEVFISDLRPLIKNVNDAMIVVPLIKGYLDTANVNDEHLIRLAAIIQRIITAQSQSESDGSPFGLSEEEKKQLMSEIDKIKESEAIVVKSITKKKD
jgi:predicted RNA polymerase sigma factor